jgi:hypothetical protein
MKVLTASLLLAFAAAFPAQAMYEAKVPHTSGGMRIGGRFSPTRYSFRLHVTGRMISELKLRAPEGLSLSKSIDIIDQSGRKVAATIGTQGQTTTISFAQPVALGTKLKINLNDVERTYNALIWELETSAVLDGLQGDIPLQTVRLSPQ